MSDGTVVEIPNQRWTRCQILPKKSHSKIYDWSFPLSHTCPSL